MSNVYTGRKVYRNSRMLNFDFDSGDNMQGVVETIDTDTGWFYVAWTDGTKNWYSLEWHNLYLPTA